MSALAIVAEKLSSVCLFVHSVCSHLHTRCGLAPHQHLNNKNRFEPDKGGMSFFQISCFFSQALEIITSLFGGNHRSNPSESRARPSGGCNHLTRSQPSRSRSTTSAAPQSFRSFMCIDPRGTLTKSPMHRLLSFVSAMLEPSLRRCHPQRLRQGSVGFH